MGRIARALLYMGALICANAALADVTAAEAARAGDMKKLLFHDAPREVSDEVFTAPDGTEHTLASWKGKVILLNFWATWCAPCREEMPALDALQAEMGGGAFEVVTVATGRNELAGIRRFFEEEGVENLPILLDSRSALARDMAVLGLPITVLIDAGGREIARLRGDADWSSESAKAVIGALIGEDAAGG